MGDSGKGNCEFWIMNWAQAASLRQLGANEAYKAAIRYIVGQAEGRAIQVVVEKRGKVEELRTLKN